MQEFDGLITLKELNDSCMLDESRSSKQSGMYFNDYPSFDSHKYDFQEFIPNYNINDDISLNYTQFEELLQFSKIEDKDCSKKKKVIRKLSIQEFENIDGYLKIKNNRHDENFVTFYFFIQKQNKKNF